MWVCDCIVLTPMVMSSDDDSTTIKKTECECGGVVSKLDCVCVCVNVMFLLGMAPCRHVE